MKSKIKFICLNQNILFHVYVLRSILKLYKTEQRINNSHSGIKNRRIENDTSREQYKKKFAATFTKHVVGVWLML